MRSPKTAEQRLQQYVLPMATPPADRQRELLAERVDTHIINPPTNFPFLQPALQPDELGRLGTYRVLRLLNKGSMALVFQAEDVTLHRPVALKVMKPGLSGNPIAWQRFLREARILAAIKHPHLPAIFQAGQEGEIVYLVMELLEGESLKDRLARAGRLEPADALSLAIDIATGLSVIHRHGLIHRDIKPANLWLSARDGRLKILDFGLARQVHDQERLTRAGTVVGTPSYMSPEQARGQRIDARTDLFSLGCVLYNLCTGKNPVDASNTMDALKALLQGSPRLVRELNPAVPQSLADLVADLLAPVPDDRPPCAEAVLERLETIRTRLRTGSGSRRAPTAVSRGFGRLARRGRGFFKHLQLAAIFVLTAFSVLLLLSLITGW